MSETNKKDWERPWSTQEIRDNADNWNLACDAALLNTLKDFGDRMIGRCEEVYKKVENLCDDLEKSSLRVDLARNEFNSLRNSQFVECRVYEEDETLLTVQNQEEKAEKTKVPKEETMEDLKDAVALGLKILDKYYDKVEVTVSDSEDEDMVDDVPSYVYRRKDPYLNRPLPYVIGTEQWYNKWHVGLQESSDSENEKSASEKFSDSESEDDNFQNKNNSDTSSEISLNGKGKSSFINNNNDNVQDYLASSGSDISSTPTPKPNSFAEQLAAKLGHVIRENNHVALLDEPEINRRPIQKKTSDYGALFCDEPPPIEEQPPPGIFSGGKSLFDEDDDDDSLFWTRDDDNSASKNDHNIDPPYTSFEKANKKSRRSLVKPKGLFDDDEDTDDDIFSSKKPSIRSKGSFLPYNNVEKTLAPIFQEEPPLLDKKKPIGGVPVLGHADIFKDKNVGKILKQRRRESSPDESEDDDFTISKQETKQAEISQKTTEKTQKIRRISSEQPISSKEKPANEKIGGLFDEEEDSNEKFLIDKGKSKKNTKKSGLFDEDLFDDADDLFSSSFLEKTDKNKSSKLFEEKEETSIKKIEKEEQNIENEYDYSWRESSSSKIIEKDFKTKNNDLKKGSSTTKPILSLFDDDEDEVDDLFSKILKNDRKNSETPSKPKKIDGKISENERETSTAVLASKSDQNRVENVSDNLKSRLSQVETSTVNDLTSKIRTEKSGKSEVFHDKRADATSATIVDINETSVPGTSNIETSPVKTDLTSKRDRKEVENEGNRSGRVVLAEETSNVDDLTSKCQDFIVKVPGMDFLDSNPPPVNNEDWETNSDNAFDDFDQESYCYQSQPSSLFDNEPPSLFFHSNNNENRSTFATKSTDSAAVQSSNLQSERNPETSAVVKETSVVVKETSVVAKETSVVAKETSVVAKATSDKENAKISSQLNDSIDETDDFNFEKKDNNNSEIKDFIGDKKQHEIEQKLSNDKDKIKNIDDRPDTEEVIDEMQRNNNIAKIAEKLQQLSSRNEEKPKVVPKKLSHNLNINVGALLPGSTPPPRKEKNEDGDDDDDQGLSKSTEGREEAATGNIFEGTATTAPPIARTVSENDSPGREYRLEKSVSFDDEIARPEILQSVTKNRAKVPVRRKPSSRRTRNSHSVPDFAILDGNTKEEKEEHREPQQEEKNVEKEKPLFGDEEDLFNSIPENKKYINEELEEEREHKEIQQQNILKTEKSVTLFEDEDLFKSIPESRKNIKEKQVHKEIQQKRNIGEEKSPFEDIQEDLKKTMKEKQEHKEIQEKNVEKEKSLFEEIQKDLRKKIEEKQEHKEIQQEKIVEKEKSPFEDIQEDLFQSISESKKNIINEAEIKSLKVEEKRNSFEENAETEEKPKVPGKIDIFGPHEDDDDIDASLFGNTRNIKIKDLIEKVKGETARGNAENSGKIVVEPKKKVDIFESSDEDEGFLLFKSTKQQRERESTEKEDEDGKKIISMVGNSVSSGDDKLKREKKNLFEFSDEDDDDFFENLGAKRRNSKKEIDNSRGDSLFDDNENLLFRKGKSSQSKQENFQQPTTPAVISEKKSTKISKLENVEGVNDPLSALLK